MVKLALFVRLEAKPGKEADVQKFLEAGLAEAHNEAETIMWFALRLGPSTFGVFDAFHNEAGRRAHMHGKIAAALMAKGKDLFSQRPTVEEIEILGVKNAA